MTSQPADDFGFLIALPYPVMVVSGALTIARANDAAEMLFDRALSGLDMTRILNQPEALDCVSTASKSGGMQSCDIVLSQGTQRNYKLSAAPLGRDRLIVISLLDISASLAAERARSQFVANVSHELRSPLAALMGAVETLQGPARNDPDAQAQFLQLMQIEAQRMSRLVGDLLSLSKLESKEHILPNGEVDIERCLRQVKSSLEASQSEYQGRINLSFVSDIPKAVGSSDELIEVFQNLIENALKYSAVTSSVDVSAQVKSSRSDERKSLIVITVKDSGDGVEETHIPRLTERFYRVDKGRSREKGGTGLGLAITKHIVNRHRGRLHIASRIGYGTTVTVSLRGA